MLQCLLSTQSGHGRRRIAAVQRGAGPHFVAFKSLLVCGANLADLAALRRKRNVERVMRNRHREKYNDYMRGYMLRYRARKREAASQ